MKVFNYLAVGLSIGFVITTVFMAVFQADSEVTHQVIAWCIASALYGISSMVFEIKSLNTLCLSILHYIICFVITGVNIYLFYREYISTVLVSFTIIYVVIYVVIWLQERRNMRVINKKLSE